MRHLSLFALLLTTSLATAAEPAGTKSKLFTGENLDGWHVTGCEVGV